MVHQTLVLESGAMELKVRWHTVAKHRKVTSLSNTNFDFFRQTHYIYKPAQAIDVWMQS